ncbi:MAG: LLM class flavin-dependent oxidoreductase, partial [Chloroflexi bacterium]|nr:LLM class flavin-dependent oxidoreductase [Chloroflexota bacterium]MCI0799530.1 LLM class flavin-dependent oxidoreductase [Chloroflexota bacterium]MCI0879743.1 LLM class flavin-dependent oxidoreductase [Chloroflexota bacterium]
GVLTMEFSLAYEMQRPELDDHAVIEETIEQCILADEMGFDSIWFVEHHFLTTFSMSPCPEVILSAIAAQTKRIRLGFGVVILPYHHPVRVAERVAMLDHISNGRVEFGTGRSAPYEQTGMGIDPRLTREMWEESLTMIPKIWESDTFEWEGRFWSVPPRQVLPKPYQKPHPPIWVAALQPATYQIAAEKGIGVMALGVSAPSVLEPHIKAYRETIKDAKPVGNFVNNKWLSSCFGLCGEDNEQTQELCARSLKTFFGPGRPYVQDQKDVYARLLDQWGGIPDHLAQNFSRYIDVEGQVGSANGGSSAAFDLSGGGALAQRIWEEFDAATMAERGIIVAGDPDSCIEAVKLHEATGVDQLQFLMATETVDHQNVLKSIEMFGKHVIPAFRKTQEPAG